jgi:hypothetical protein
MPVSPSPSVSPSTAPEWLGISKPSMGGVQETIYKPIVRTEFEGNYVQVRARSTRARKMWTLTWNVITEADYQVLAAYFNTTQGSTFTWIHPVTGTEYTCIFSEPILTSQQLLDGYRSTSLKIEEV